MCGIYLRNEMFINFFLIFRLYSFFHSRWPVEVQKRTEVHYKPSERRILRYQIACSFVGAAYTHRDGSCFPANLLLTGAQ